MLCQIHTLTCCRIRREGSGIELGRIERRSDLLFVTYLYTFVTLVSRFYLYSCRWIHIFTRLLQKLWIYMFVWPALHVCKYVHHVTNASNEVWIYVNVYLI